MTATRMLAWAIEATGGFDTAWATLDGDRLTADGRAVGQQGGAYWIDYRLEATFLMAFIEVPTLRVVANEQGYTHLRTRADGGAIVRYASGSFTSDLRVDADGFVIEYPQLGRRVEPMR